MSSVRLSLGLPLGGVNRELRQVIPFAEAMDKWYASDISGLRFSASNRLAPWPAITAYANTTNAFRVTRLFNIRWGDGTADLVRHSRGAGGTGFNGFHESSGGAWVSRSAAINLGTTDDAWGSAVVPGNTGKGYYVFSNRVATTGGPWRWDGTGVDAVAIANADPGKFVVSFANRCFIFNQVSGGVVQSRRSQWSRPGDSTSWTGTGSGTRPMNEIDGDITGAALLRSGIVVYGPNSIVVGAEQYIPNAPVRYEVFSKGIGNWAPPSLVVEDDEHFFLSQQGFKGFNGSQIEDIGAPINSYILKNLNRNALNNVVSFSFKPWRSIIWGLPIGSGTEVTELWMFNTTLRAWTKLDSAAYFPSALTAAAVVDQTSAPTWDSADLAAMLWDGTLATDGINRAGRTWIDEAGAGIRPQIITGHVNGVTRTLDDTALNSTLRFKIDSPIFSFSGIPLFANRDSAPSERIMDEDFKVLDRFATRYRSLSSASSILYIYISEDGGQNFTLFGSINLAAGTGEQLKYNFCTGRVSGSTIMLRLTNVSPSGVVSPALREFEDFSLGIKRAGEVRGAA